MISKNTEANIDFGLHVTFDGKYYKMVMPNHSDVYTVGGMLCEYCRFAPTTLKDVILSCNGLNLPATVNNFVSTFMELQEKLTDCFLPIIGTMVAVEFMNAAEDWFNAINTDRLEEYHSLLGTKEHDAVKDYILKDTGIEEFGGNTVLQLLLTCYYQFANCYTIVKHLFLKLNECEDQDDEAHKNIIDAFTSMYSSFMETQHIDYRIILTEKGFESLYTIKTSMSLLLFEMAHCINNDTKIVKCKNCGHYFVPEGRSDAKYCSYPIAESGGKTCRDIGAQVTRANKEKNDILTKEYRKIYMRLKMAISRHPGDAELEERFNQLTREFKIRKAEIMDNKSTTEEVLEWLANF